MDPTNLKPEVLEKKTEDGSNGSNRDLEAVVEKSRPRYGNSNRTVGNRIAPVLPHLAAYDFGSDDSGEDLLGKQIELEAGNAIQYRTCSWQKVLFYPSPLYPHVPYNSRSKKEPKQLTWKFSLPSNRNSQKVADHLARLLLCSSPNTSAWPLCRFLTPTPSLAFFQASS